MQSFYGTSRSRPVAADSFVDEAAACAETRSVGQTLERGLGKPYVAAGLIRSPNPPALLRESVQALLAPGFVGTYVDATFSQSGYSSDIIRHLPPGSSFIVFCHAKSQLCNLCASRPDIHVQVEQAMLGDVAGALRGLQLSGIIVDFASAWQQHEDAFRGLSVVDESPLDLRLDPSRGISAAEWLKNTTVAELAWVIHAYGEDDDPLTSLRIAEAVLDKQQRLGPYRTVYELVEAVRKVKTSCDERGHPAKATIQALRSFINGELEQLEDVLSGTLPLLLPGARAIIVTCRRVEAAAVKTFVRQHEDTHPLFEAISDPGRLRDLYPLLNTNEDYAVRQVQEPMWPATQGEGVSARQVHRSVAGHVIQRVARKHHNAGLDNHEEGIRTRSHADLFVQPKAGVFTGA